MTVAPILWGRGNSSNVQRVLWACAEAGVAPERRIVGGAHGGLDAPGFAALTPARTVPVLQDGDVVAWQSHAALRHLGETRAPALYPRDPARRAEVDSWLEWSATVLWPPARELYRRGWLGGETGLGPQHEALARAAVSVDAVLADRPWIAGDTFGLADITLGVTINRLRSIEAVPSGEHLARWFVQASARPAFAVVADAERIPGRGNP